MNKYNQRSFEKLQLLVKPAKIFCDKLNEMSNIRQVDQLNYIIFYLNNLVVHDVRCDSWSNEMNRDIEFANLIESLEELKNLRNIIIHESWQLEHEEYMSALAKLYKYGLNIDYKIENAIKLLEENY